MRTHAFQAAVGKTEKKQPAIVAMTIAGWEAGRLLLGAAPLLLLLEQVLVLAQAFLVQILLGYEAQGR